MLAPPSVDSRPSAVTATTPLAPPHGPKRRVAAWFVAAAVYLALSALVWWHLWSAGIGHSLVTGSLDPAANVWWLAWMPHALGSGLNPLFTSAMYHPSGVNTLANTSVPLVALLMSPLTVAAGPMASFAVALVLAPAVDALVAYAVLRRFTSWPPAAFVGGLLYGFGPFVGTDLRYGHLNLTVLVVPPLALLVLDRILVRRTGSPVRAGLWLAACVVAEFFVSVEMLALGVVVAACAVLLVVAARGRAWREGLGYSATSLATAGVVSAGVLAYPTWWYLSGPRHFNGAVWGNMSGFVASLAAFVQPHGELFGVKFLSGGNGDFLGVPLLVVLAAGLVLWRGDRVLRFALSMTVCCAVLALGSELHVGHSSTAIPMPAWPFLHLPLLSSAATSRFGAYMDLFAALGLSLVVGHVRRQLRWERSGRLLSASGALAVAGVGLISAALVPSWPFPVDRVEEPAVLSALAELPAGTVASEYPLASGTHADGLALQAQDGLSYVVTGGYAIVPGRAGHATIAPPQTAIELMFVAASLGRLGQPPQPSLVPVVRAQAFADGVDAVAVVLPSRGGSALIAILRAALGPPVLEDRSGALWLATPTISGLPPPP